MPLVKGVPTNKGEKEGQKKERKRNSTAIGSSNVKMVADRHRHMLLIITNTGNELLRNLNNDDLE